MKNPQITATWIVSLLHFDIVVRVNGQVVKRTQCNAGDFPETMAKLAGIMWVQHNNQAREVA